MKPIKFKHSNIVFAKDQPQYQSLPALRLDSPEGEVISCWRLTFIERLKVLIFGRVWMSLMMFGQPLTPSRLAVNRKEVFSLPSDVKWWWKYFKKIKSNNLVMESIEHAVIRILMDKLGTEESETVLSANLENDLGMDSLDFVEIMMELEEEYSIRIPNTVAEKISTVENLINAVNNLSLLK